MQVWCREIHLSNIILNQIASVQVGFYTMRLIGKKRIKCKTKALPYQKRCPKSVWIRWKKPPHDFFLYFFLFYNNNKANF